MTGRLLVVGHAADRTGPPIYLLNLLRWLRAHDVAVDVEVVLLSGGELLEDLRRLAPVTVFTPLSGEVPDDVRARMRAGEVDEDRWWAERRAAALADLMRPFAAFEAVYVTCAPAIELARALPPGERAVLSHAHELEIGLTHRLAPGERRAFLHESTRVFAVAEAVIDHVVEAHGVAADGVDLVPEMIDVDAARAVAVDPGARDEARRARGIDPDGLVVGGCGTMDFRKGFDLFLRVAWHLSRSTPDRPVSFVWVGGDEATVARGRAEADALGVEDVHLVGAQGDPAAWFSLFDLLALTSREDPYPLVCIEAAAVGTPVVAFDTGGIPELLRDGCGEVVGYPDVAAFAAVVGELLDDPTRRAAMGERGRDLARQRHDVAVVAPQLWAAIERWT